MAVKHRADTGDNSAVSWLLGLLIVVIAVTMALIAHYLGTQSACLSAPASHLIQGVSAHGI